MRARNVVGAGIVGALGMSVLLAIGRGFGVPARLETWLGTLFGVQPGAGAYVVGLCLHIAIGVGFAWVYAAIFDRWGPRASRGAILGLGHAVLAGLLLAFLPIIHPMIPERLASPGAYMANLGFAGVVMFFVIHLVYGSIVGGMMAPRVGVRPEVSDRPPYTSTPPLDRDRAKRRPGPRPTPPL